MMLAIEFNGIHLMIVFAALAVGFVAGVVMGYLVRDDMIKGGQS